MAIPIPRVFWPITITASNKAFTFTAFAGPQAYTGNLEEKTYYDPETLATAFQTAIGTATRTGPVAFTAGDGGAVVVTLSGDGKLSLSFSSIASTAPVFASATGDTAKAILGFTATATGTALGGGSASTVTVPSQIQHLWTPSTPVVSDSGRARRTQYEAVVVETIGGQSQTAYWASRTQRSIETNYLPASKIWTADETSTTTNEAVQRLIEGVGRSRFRYWPDRTVFGTADSSAVTDPSAPSAWTDYFLRQPTMAEITVRRLSPAVARFAFDLDLGAYQS